MRGLDFELKLLLLFGDWLLLFWWASLVMMGQAAELVEWKETTQGTKQSEESSNESHLGFGQPGFRAHWLEHAFSLYRPRDLQHCLWQLYGTRVVNNNYFSKGEAKQRFQ